MLLHTTVEYFPNNNHFLFKQVCMQELSDKILALFLEGRIHSTPLSGINNVSKTFGTNSLLPGWVTKESDLLEFLKQYRVIQKMRHQGVFQSRTPCAREVSWRYLQDWTWISQKQHKFEYYYHLYPRYSSQKWGELYTLHLESQAFPLHWMQIHWNMVPLSQR